jgi:hypothetical protein
MKKNIILTLVVVAIASMGTVANAATITYVGGQSNFEAHTDDPTVGWRNATTAKTLDIDGDNIIGTDGYDIAGGGPEVLPSYVSSATFSGGHNQLHGFMDDPLDPDGTDMGAGWTGNSSGNTIVFQGSDLTTKTLRLGVLYDSGWSLAWGTQTFTLTQTVGGSASATTPTLTLAGDGIDVAYFDVTGVQDGDTLKLTVADVSINWNHMAGVTFDTVIPEPATMSLLALGGLGLLRRRRR